MRKDQSDTPRRYTVDRFEDGDWAVLEDAQGKTFDIPVTWLPEVTTEGSVLRLELSTEDNARLLRFSLDEHVEITRRERVRDKLARLRQEGRGHG